jgi:sugar/nucleoside kinase (ribokinase family)
LQSVFIRAAPDALVESSLSPTGGAFLDFVGFTLIVDDIVFPDGHTEMALLGGGGPQTLWGYMLIASNLREDGPARVGLLAGIGADLPEKIADWFTGMGIDTNGMYETTHPTPRAWQILEADGRRTQVWRSEPSEALYSMLRPDLRLLPSAYCQASVYHLGINPTTYDLEYLLQIKALARDAATRGNDDDDFNRPMSRVGLLSIEPFVAVEGDEKLTQEKLAGLCSVGDVFSPNETEAFSLVGPGTPLEVIQ